MNAKQQFLRNLPFQIITGLVINVILIYVLTPVYIKDSWLRATIVLCTLAAAWIIYLFPTKRWRLLKLLWSGWVAGCYFTFPVDENPKVWGQAKRSLKYLGISSNTFIDKLREWVANDPSCLSLEYRFLLMNPEAKALTKQVQIKLGLEVTNDAVTSEVKVIRGRIETCIVALKALELYKNGKLKIRLYDEVIPWWIYIIDDGKAFVGVLEKGRSGENSPLMVFKKHDKFGSPYNAFENDWQRIWDSNSTKDA